MKKLNLIQENPHRFGLRREAKRHAAFAQPATLVSKPTSESGVATLPVRKDLCHRAPKFATRASHLRSHLAFILGIVIKLSSLIILLALQRASALTPIQYNASDFTGATNNLPVTLTSLLKVQVNNQTLLIGLPINFTPTNGTYTTNVYAGLYNLTIQGIPVAVTCLVPDSTNVQNLASCVISNLGLFSAANLNALITNPVALLPGTNIQMTTNGFTVTINGVVTNLNGLNWTNITGGLPTTLAGYGITDAQKTNATLTTLAANNGGSLTNLTASNLVGTIPASVNFNQGIATIGSPTQMLTGGAEPNVNQAWWYFMGNSNLLSSNNASADAGLFLVNLNTYTPGSSIGFVPTTTNSALGGWSPVVTNTNGAVVGTLLAQTSQIQIGGLDGPKSTLPGISQLVVSSPGQWAATVAENYIGGSSSQGNYPFWITDPANNRTRFPWWNWTSGSLPFNLTNFYKDALVVTNSTGNVGVGNNLNVSNNLSIGPSAGISAITVNGTQWNSMVSGQSNLIAGGQIDPNSAVTLSNLTTTTSGNNPYAITVGHAGFGFVYNSANGGSLDTYSLNTQIARMFENNYVFEPNIIIEPNITAQGAIGDFNFAWGYGHFVTNQVGTLTVSNAPTFSTTNATPGGWTAGSGASSPRIWIPFTNGSTVYYLPGY